MSLWFQAPPSNYDPTETRSVGFGQIKRGGSVFGQPQDSETSQMSAAAGGLTQDFSSKVSISPTIDAAFNFDGPYFNNNSMTLDNAINNNILQNFQVNNLMQTIENILQTYFGGSAYSGITTSVTVITGVSLVTGNLRFSTTTLYFNNGLITGTAAGSNIDIATSTCA